MESIERLARAAGVRGAPRPEAVRRRRVQLWLLWLLAVMALPAAFVVLGVLPPELATFINPTAVRGGLAMLLVAIVGYVIEGERSLRGLSGLLLDERLRTSILEAWVHQLDLLLRACRAMNASLDLDAVLGIILTSASELLGASEGSISLLRTEVPDELEVVATSGRSPVHKGERRAIGAELAGLTAHGAGSAPVVLSPASLAVPLMHRDEVVGVLDLVIPQSDSLTEFQLRSVSVFAETAAAAVSNARVHGTATASVATLTELDRLKDEFLALITHELRTPLTSVIGLAQTIERGADRLPSARVADLARLIGREGWRLDRLVDDLLRSTQVQRGVLALTPAPVRVADLTRETVAGLQAGAPGHRLTLDLPDDPVVRFLDGEAVHRILVNLLGNAAKYTPAGTEVRVTVDGTDPGRVVLVVDDDGPGIPEPEWERVFDKFRRGRGRDREHGSGGGLGLGLYLVRALALAHGGDATLDRSSRGGCRFTVSLASPADRTAIPTPV